MPKGIDETSEELKIGSRADYNADISSEKLVVATSTKQFSGNKVFYLERPLVAVVLAAGEGTRMKSSLPKPLHRICGRPMVLHVLDALGQLPLEKVVVVVGHGLDQVTKVIMAEANANLPIEFVEQATQRGTGDAVSVGLTAMPEHLELDSDADVIVLPGDAPLITPKTIASLVESHFCGSQVATLLTANVKEPEGYGRILRDKHANIVRIVEQSDIVDDSALINEICTSVYVFKYSVLGPGLRRLIPQNQQKEYYLTDIVEVLANAGYQVAAVTAEDPNEAIGVNDKAQLAAAESRLRDRINNSWMKKGVTIVDPSRCYIDTSVILEEEVILQPNTILRGKTSVAKFAEIGPNCELTDCVIGEGAVIKDTVAESSEMRSWSKVGPFAFLSPGTIIEPRAVTGSFYTDKDLP